MVDEVAERGFGAGADAYERGRPGYAPEVVRFLRERLDLGPGRRLLDLGAGTGKLTRLLTPSGARVVALEPVWAMAAKLPATAPAAAPVVGVAEALPLAEGAVDAAVAAQAFHWFDAPRALAALRRVLRPGGALALVWNVRDERVPWVAAMSEAIHWHRHEVSHYGATDWPAVVAAAGGWSPAERHAFRYEQPVTRSTLADRVTSISYIATLPEAEQAALVARVLALVADQPEAFTLPYRTDVFVTERR